MPEPRVMGIAVSSARIGYAMFVDDLLIDWGVSVSAAKHSTKAAAKVRELIDLHKPHAVVTELAGSNKRKRGKTFYLLKAVTRAVEMSEVTSVTTTRTQSFRNKYQEAHALAREFPELAPRLASRRKIWLSEPRRMILFEALALALRLRATR